jgi:inhibitor of KinA sporulation pathway (predicted exonuclease)
MAERDESSFLVFGTRRADLHGLARELQEVLGITLEARDGLYQGGEYYLGRLPSGIRLGLFPNYNPTSEHHRDPDHTDRELLVYFYGASPADLPGLTRALAPIGGLTHLKSRERPTVVNVIDVEATCWEGEPPEGQHSDIIEIGVTELDYFSLEVGATRSILVRPAHSEISEFCTRLTTLTPAQIEGEGVAYEDALKILRKELRSRDRIFASYGDYDRKMFDRQCKAYGAPSPFGPRHLNVKSLLALTLGLDEEIGMAEALERLGLPLEGTHHRGGDDSRNIARILARLLRAARSGLD